MKSFVNIEASHLMRCLAWNAMQITLINDSVNYAKESANNYFFNGQDVFARSKLQEVAKFKKEIASLAVTQKAIKAALRTGWRDVSKKHGKNCSRYEQWLINKG